MPPFARLAQRRPGGPAKWRTRPPHSSAGNLCCRRSWVTGASVPAFASGTADGTAAKTVQYKLGGASVLWDTGAYGQSIVPADVFNAFLEYYTAASAKVGRLVQASHCWHWPSLRELRLQQEALGWCRTLRRESMRCDPCSQTAARPQSPSYPAPMPLSSSLPTRTAALLAAAQAPADSGFDIQPCQDPHALCGSNLPSSNHSCQYIALPPSPSAEVIAAAKAALLAMYPPTIDITLEVSERQL